MKQAMHLRPADAGDLGPLNSIMRESSAYTGHYRAILEGYEITPRHLADNHFYLAESGAAVLGFYALVPGSEPELDLMFVSDRAQGMGLGRTLFDHMLGIASRLGFDSVKIVSHPPSVGFYLRMGARQTGILPPRGRVTWERPVLRASTARAPTGKADD